MEDLKIEVGEREIIDSQKPKIITELDVDSMDFDPKNSKEAKATLSGNALTFENAKKYKSISYMRRENQQEEYRVREYLKCKHSALYFIKNYVKVQVPGGVVSLKESPDWLSTPKYQNVIKLMQYGDFVSLMASRQHFKTTTVLQYLLWAMSFHPGIKIEFLTLKSKSALDAMERMYSMLSLLPSWLRVPKYNKGEKATYLELDNKSRINSNYVSGSINPDTVGRGMSAPLVYIDEAAFIPHMETVWASLYPVVSKAGATAKANGVPNGVILSTTPNGAGENWFYKSWMNAWAVEELWDTDKNRLREDVLEVQKTAKDKNNFIKMAIHWSETGKSKEWFNDQVKALDFNMRKVNQEINLVFLGSTGAIFPDEILEKFTPPSTIFDIQLAYGQVFKIFEELDPTKVYLLGVDNAASTAAAADYSALVLTEAESGKQVGEYKGKFSVIKRYAGVVKSLILQLSTIHGLSPDYLKVIIERNTFGIGVIEEVIFGEGPENWKYEYEQFVYFGKVRGELIPGLNTNKNNREQMFNLLLSLVNTNPYLIRGMLLQEELRNLEQKSSGRIEAARGQHDDIVMAYNFTLLIRHEMIQRGEIITSETPDGLKISTEQIINYMDVTFSTTSVLNKNKNKNFEEIQIQDVFNDKSEELRKIKEIREAYGIPKKLGGSMIEGPQEEDEFGMECFQIF